MTKLKQLRTDLHTWATKAVDKIGYFQEFDINWGIHSDKDGYIYSIELVEVEDKHVLCGANGRSPDKAIEQLYAGRISQGFKFWGWPSEFPVKT